MAVGKTVIYTCVLRSVVHSQSHVLVFGSSGVWVTVRFFLRSIQGKVGRTKSMEINLALVSRELMLRARKQVR